MFCRSGIAGSFKKKEFSAGSLLERPREARTNAPEVVREGKIPRKRKMIPWETNKQDPREDPEQTKKHQRPKNYTRIPHKTRTHKRRPEKIRKLEKTRLFTWMLSIPGTASWILFRLCSSCRCGLRRPCCISRVAKDVNVSNTTTSRQLLKSREESHKIAGECWRVLELSTWAQKNTPKTTMFTPRVRATVCVSGETA